MLRLHPQRSTDLKGILPDETLSFLRDAGVPERVAFRGLDIAFDLRLQPLQGGALFEVGDVDRGFYTAALQRGTGHFGVLSAEEAWSFVNLSLAQFLACVEAAERMWGLEQHGQISSSERGEWLEGEIRRIDPRALLDADGPWAFLVEELRNEVV